MNIAEENKKKSSLSKDGVILTDKNHIILFNWKCSHFTQKKQAIIGYQVKYSFLMWSRFVLIGLIKKIMLVVKFQCVRVMCSYFLKILIEFLFLF